MKFIGDQYNDNNGREYQHVPDGGKERHILPHPGEKVDLYTWKWNRGVFVDINDHAVDHVLCHQEAK
jgi:hypothetical protein